VPERGENQF